MTATEFAQYLSGEAALADLPTATLAEYVAKYPYSAPLQGLLLKKMQTENPADFAAQLPISAAIAPDRQQLYKLLYPNINNNIDNSISRAAESIEVETIEIKEITAPRPAFVSQNPPQISAIELGIIK